MSELPGGAAAAVEQGLGARICDGAGGARSIGLGDTSTPLTAPSWLWVHLDRARPEHRDWLLAQSGIGEVACTALLEEETRPRFAMYGSGMLLILRGVNMNPGAEPDDMISLRLWVEGHRIVSLRHRRLLAVQDVRERLENGDGPRTPGGMVIAIAARLIERQASVIDAMEDAVDEVEENIVSHPGRELRVRLADFRRQAIGLRRYIAPQRDVLFRLVHERVPCFDDSQLSRLREICERQVRLIEEVDAIRERAGVTQEELAGRLAEQMNRNTYVLSVVAGVFLPLGLLTGLLGINVGGIPGSDNPYGFLAVCILLVVLAVVMAVFFRRMRIM